MKIYVTPTKQHPPFDEDGNDRLDVLWGEPMYVPDDEDSPELTWSNDEWAGGEGVEIVGLVFRTETGKPVSAVKLNFPVRLVRKHATLTVSLNDARLVYTFARWLYGSEREDLSQKLWDLEY